MRKRKILILCTLIVFLYANFLKSDSSLVVQANGIPGSEKLGPVRPMQSNSRTLIAAGQTWRYFQGQSEPPAEWNQIGFDDSTWLLGETGIGYGSAYSNINRTILPDMYNKYLAVYLRRNFEILDLSAVAHIWLNIDFDDGFVAYLNGHEIARRNMGAAHSPAPFSQNALGYQEAGKTQVIDLTDHLTSLVKGENVLAVQVHNASITSSDLSITPGLSVEEQPDDLADVLLLYDPNASQEMDKNFRHLVEYYGLKYAAYDLIDHPLRDRDFLDSDGNFYRLVAASESALAWLDDEELTLLQTQVHTNKVILMVYDMAESASPKVSFLTNGSVTGSFQPIDAHLDWIFGNGLHQITREFSGQTLNGFGEYDQVDYGLVFDQTGGGNLPANITPLIQASDDTAQVYTLFASYKAGSGSILLQGRNSGKTLGVGTGNIPMNNLYSVQYLSEITPLMMALRYAAGDEAWHRTQDTANFTIDDPYLKCDYGPGPCHWKYIYWQNLLSEMQEHNFHTTIAMIPNNYQLSMPEVVTLVRQNPQYYSLAVHGNNHDGLTPADDCPEFSPLVSAPDQEADIQESIWRMNQHQLLFDLPFSRVMVFPCGSGTLTTYDLLKKYNFSLTTNGVEAPTDATPTNTWDRRMDLAEMAYSNFPNLLRANTDNATPQTYSYLFDLFRDQPVMLYSHASYGLTSVLSAGSDGFNSYADAINNLPGEVAWQNLEEIAQQLYKEKLNDAGVVEVQMYSTHIRLQNSGTQAQIYQVAREENFSYPLHVLVDGQDTSYQTRDEAVMLFITVPAKSSRDVLFAYNTGLVQQSEPGSLAVNENGTQGQYSLRLQSKPEADVTVMLTTDGQVTITPDTLVFNPENWEIPQLVHVNAVDDGLPAPPYRVGVITHTLSSGSPFFQGIVHTLEVPIWQYENKVFLPFIRK